MNYKQMLEEFDRLNKVSIDMESEFKRLEVKFDELLRRIKRIEERLDAMSHPPQPMPVPETNPFTPYTPPISPWDMRTCTKCGLKLEGTMGYVCTQPRCPTGLGGAWS